MARPPCAPQFFSGSAGPRFVHVHHEQRGPSGYRSRLTAVIVAGETLRKHLQLALQRISSDNVHNSPIGIGLGIETARHTVWETASGGRERTVGRRVRVQLGPAAGCPDRRFDESVPARRHRRFLSRYMRGRERPRAIKRGLLLGLEAQRVRPSRCMEAIPPQKPARCIRI